jgi:hypothetical protein
MLVDLIDQCGASVAVLGNTYRIQRKFFSIRARRNGEIYERIGSFATSRSRARNHSRPGAGVGWPDVAVVD